MVTRSPHSNATSASRNNDPADADDRQFERLVARLHNLGPRALCELLIEVGVQTMHRTTIEQMLTRYVGTDPNILNAFKGDQFAPHPDLRVVGHEP